MFRHGCQTFRPIVRPLLSALTELDPDVAVAPEHPNLSIWFRSGGLLNIRRYLHPRLPRRQSLWLSPQEKTFVVTRSPEAKLAQKDNKKGRYNCNFGSNLAKYPSHRGHLVRRNCMCNGLDHLSLATATGPILQETGETLSRGCWWRP